MDEKQFYSEGNLIIPEGSFQRDAFIIDKGSVEVSQMDKDGKKVVIAIRGEKEIIGEMALIEGNARCATVIALEDCELSILPFEKFQNLPDSNPGVKAIKKNMNERREK